MFRGWLQYGDTEVVNTSRTAAYAANGIVVPGVVVSDCADCDDLPEVLGDEPYDTPLQDRPPWLDDGNPDSADFAGFIVLDVTGLAGSTMTATVNERIGDGGIVGYRRAASRTIAVSALAVGRTEQGLDAGISWLASVLHPPCAGGDCRGDVLHMFSACPTACEGQTDLNAAVVNTDYTASPDLVLGVPTTLGPVLPGVCDDVTVLWNVTSPSGNQTVTPGLADPSGRVLVTGDPVVVGASAVTASVTVPVTPGFPNDWRPVLTVAAPVVVQYLNVQHRPILTLEECVEPYRRTLRNVTTIEGPLLIEPFAPGSETTIARIEWTWVAAEPHVWQEPVPLLTDVPSLGTGPVGYQAPGVELSAVTRMPYGTVGPPATGTVCPRPAPSLLSCADNACCPPGAAPPLAPVLTDPCVMNHYGFSIDRRTFSIPEDVAPAGLGVLSWVFVNDANPKLGVRVRIWADPDPDFGVLSECAFSEEFTIDYLGPNHVLHIDGPGGRVDVLCGEDAWEQPIWANALRNVRGNYGGPFHNGPIGCGKRYHVAVDVPVQYTATCTGSYVSGDPQGALAWSVDLTRRA